MCIQTIFHLLQEIQGVVVAVKSLFSECASCVAHNDDSTYNYMALRVESVILTLEELMQYVGSTCQFQSPQSHARDYFHTF